MDGAGPSKRPLSPPASSSPVASKRPRASAPFKWLAPLGPNRTCWHGLYGSSKPGGTRPIAAFDLDDTIVTVGPETATLIPKVHFARFPTDYEWLKNRKDKLRELTADGYTILLFVNIYMADDKHFDWPEIQRARIPLILEQLGVEGVHIFIATRRDEYWKPSVGVWEEWLEKWNEGVMPDKEKSFFCGDAAGRRFRARPDDHDIYDRLFADNLGVIYYEPEELFEGQDFKNEVKIRKWDPKSYDHGVPLFLPTSTPLVPPPPSTDSFDPTPPSPEVILLVGPPASGKTFLFNRFFRPRGYVLITPESPSTLTLRQNAIKAALLAGHSVAVEDWFPSRYSRATYIDRLQPLRLPSPSAQKKGQIQQKIKIRLFYFKVPYVVLKQNSIYRALYSTSKEERQDVVPQKQFEQWQQALEPPNSAQGEGVDEIKEIRFKWMGDERGKERWSGKWLGAVYGVSWLDGVQ